MENINFDDFDKYDMVGRISLLFIYNELEEFMASEAPKAKLNKVAEEKISEFVDDLYEAVDGNMSKEVLHMSSHWGDKSVDELEKTTGFSLSEVEGYDYDSTYIFVKFSREIPLDVMDQTCLSLDYNFGLDIPDEEGKLIYQGYDHGEYDTGYHSHGPMDSYINKDLGNYRFAVEKLQDI